MNNITKLPKKILKLIEVNWSFYKGVKHRDQDFVILVRDREIRTVKVADASQSKSANRIFESLIANEPRASQEHIANQCKKLEEYSKFLNAQIKSLDSAERNF